MLLSERWPSLDAPPVDRERYGELHGDGEVRALTWLLSANINGRRSVCRNYESDVEWRVLCSATWFMVGHKTGSFVAIRIDPWLCTCTTTTLTSDSYKSSPAQAGGFSVSFPP